MILNKKKKSSDRKKVIKRLDDVFSLYIRERDNYRCITCGATKEMKVIQCGHLFSRISLSTRWDELNSNAQCLLCNFFHEHDPEPYKQKWIQKYSEKEYEALYAKYRQTVKFTINDLKLMIEMFRNKTKELKKKAA